MPFDINNSILGKAAESCDCYDPSLLFRIPRSENRVQYQIDDKNLPFTGVDVWNCYELSFLTANGFPVSRVLKIIYSADSQYLVESKSLKLYLNSFNMERFEPTIKGSEIKVNQIIRKDLSLLLETEVQTTLFDENSKTLDAFKDLKDQNLTDLVPQQELEAIEFSDFLENPDLLQGIINENLQTYQFRSDLLRSNCRVTNQPDWGDLFIRISSKYEIDLSAIIKYLVSFRKENHFHEEVVEMIFKRMYDKFEPEKLMVAAMYTRRGGIDINPIRSTHKEWIDNAFLSTNQRLEKTIRQ